MPAGSLHPVSRSVTFAPGLVAAAGGWAYLGQPAHLAGLGVMAAAGLVTWPCLVMMMLFAPAVMLGACVPRRWRIGHRQRHGQVTSPAAAMTPSPSRSRPTGTGACHAGLPGAGGTPSCCTRTTSGRGPGGT